MLYVRICKALNDRGVLVPADRYRLQITSDSEHYRSLFYYNQQQYAQFQNTQSVAGFTDLVTDRLVIDLDSKENLDQALEDAKAVVKNLTFHKIDHDDIQVCFSGKKGFSIELRLAEMLKRSQLKNVAKAVAGHLESFDSSIYSDNRIIREPFTRHQETNLYKHPLTIDQLHSMSVDEIKNMSTEAQFTPDEFYEHFKDSKVKLPQSLLSFTEPEAKVSDGVAKYSMSADIDMTNKPKWMSPCKYALSLGHYKQGQRSNVLVRLAATYKNQGFFKEQVYYTLKATQERAFVLHGTSKLSKDELWKTVVEVVFADSWRGGQYSCQEDDLLQDTCKSLGIACKKNEKEGVKKISDIFPKFLHFVKNIDKNTIRTGIPEIDRQAPLTTGNNSAIVGAAGSGKSSMALNILRNTSKAGVNSVFASLDMKDTRIFEKILYMLTGENRDRLYGSVEDRESEFVELINSEFGNVNFYDKSMSTVKELREYILQCNEAVDPENRVKLVVVDYFERLFSDVTDDTAASKRLAGELQDLVNDLDICLITLVQPNKASGDVSQPILSYTNIKGSSFLYQSFRTIFSVYREGFSPQIPEQDRFLTISILKNDLGELASFDFRWNGKRGSISEMGAEDREQLRQIREQAAESRADEF
jgi:hypothetical protein